MTRLSTTTLAWRTSTNAYRLTIAVKATFELHHEAPATLIDALPFAGDAYFEDDPRRSLRVASEYVPRKGKVDVLFEGSAYAPIGSAVSSRDVRLGLLRDGMVVFARSIRALGERRRDADGAPSAPSPFGKLPMRWELAFGGVSNAANPIGCGADPSDPRLPSFVDLHDVESPACFAPIPSTWGPRARSLGGVDPSAFAAAMPIVPATFDFSYFNAAPIAQRLPKLVGDEEIELVGLHPALAEVRSRLPGVAPEVTLSIGREARTLKPIADTITMDGDRLLCSITYRIDLEVTADIAAGKIAPQIAARMVAIPHAAPPVAPPKPAAPIAATQHARTHPPTPQRAPMRTIAATQKAARGSTRFFAQTAAPSSVPQSFGGNGPMTLTVGKRGSRSPSLTAPPQKVNFASTIQAPISSPFPVLSTTTRAPAGKGAWSTDDAPAAPAAADPMAAYFAALQKKARAADEPPMLAPIAAAPEVPQIGVPVSAPRFLTLDTPIASEEAAHDEAPAEILVDEVLSAPARTTDEIPIVRATPLEVCTIHWQLRPPTEAIVVIVKGTFSFGDDGAPARLVPEQEVAVGDLHWDDDPAASLRYASDFAPFKPNADVMVVGDGYPGGAPNVGVASIRLGDLKRRIGLFGARTWSRFGAGEAAPFEKISLRWEHAFGGPQSQDDPLGVGLKSDVLPNLEDPNDLLKSKASVALPACFAPVPPEFRVRKTKVGTYGGDYLAKNWPYFPDDFDWAYFNAAPVAQQIEYPKGDERFELAGFSPKGILHGALPGVRPRVFAHQAAEAGNAFFEIGLRLDTIFFDASARKLVLVWRGLLEVSDEHAPEIAVLFAAMESPGDPPLSLEAARAKLNMRLFDRGMRGADVGANAHAAANTTRESERAAAIDAMLSAAAVERAGLAAANDAAPIEQPALPKGLSRAEIEALILAGESLAGRDLSGVDLSGADLAGLDLQRTVLARASLSGARLDRANLGGAVLTEADLRGASLDGADLSLADLTNALLDGASFDGVVATRTTFSGATAHRARFRRSNASSARFVGASLHEADFESAQLDKADFTRASIDRARFGGAALVDARLYDVIGASVFMDGAKLANARADRAVLTGASMRAIEAEKSVWEGADLSGTNLDSALLGGVIFDRATLTSTNLNRADLTDGTFRKARLRDAFFLKANLMRAIFERADLEGADLRGANLYQAETWRAKTDRARFEQANLTGTKLTR